MWQGRLQKFRDNPWVVWSFIKTHLFYRLVADRRSQGYSKLRFLSGPETIREITSRDCSLIRVGDGTFGYLSGSSIYFNDWYFRYDHEFAQKLERVLTAGQQENILFAYPHEFMLRSRPEFAAQGKSGEWRIWLTAKATAYKYLRLGRTYGDALCFHPLHNPQIDFKALRDYLATKHIVIMTANTDRFKNLRLGQSVTLIEAPRSDAWQTYEKLEATALQTVKDQGWVPTEVLFMISAAEAAKVIVYDLTKAGYTAWDTGQFFDLAAKEISTLN